MKINQRFFCGPWENRTPVSAMRMRRITTVLTALICLYITKKKAVGKKSGRDVQVPMAPHFPTAKANLLRVIEL